MRVKLQLVMCPDDGGEETVTDIVTLQKDAQRIEHLGLTLAEAKRLLPASAAPELLRHQAPPSAIPEPQHPSATSGSRR